MYNGLIKCCPGNPAPSPGPCPAPPACWRSGWWLGSVGRLCRKWFHSRPHCLLIFRARRGSSVDRYRRSWHNSLYVKCIWVKRKALSTEKLNRKRKIEKKKHSQLHVFIYIWSTTAWVMNSLQSWSYVHLDFSKTQGHRIIFFINKYCMFEIQNIKCHSLMTDLRAVPKTMFGLLISFIDKPQFILIKLHQWK